MEYGNWSAPMRWIAIMVIMGGAFMLCHWIDHNGSVAR